LVLQICDAVYRLLIAGVVALVAGLVYIVYLVSTSGAGLWQVVGFVMAMGNTYGVLLITLLMGNGLVALPMHLWRLGDIDRGLQELYLSVRTFKICVPGLLCLGNLLFAMIISALCFIKRCSVCCVRGH
jgi:hypothetical protein